MTITIDNRFIAHITEGPAGLVRWAVWGDKRVLQQAWNVQSVVGDKTTQYVEWRDVEEVISK